MSGPMFLLASALTHEAEAPDSDLAFELARARGRARLRDRRTSASLRTSEQRAELARLAAEGTSETIGNPDTAPRRNRAS